MSSSSFPRTSTSQPEKNPLSLTPPGTYTSSVPDRHRRRIVSDLEPKEAEECATMKTRVEAELDRSGSKQTQRRLSSRRWSPIFQQQQQQVVFSRQRRSFSLLVIVTTGTMLVLVVSLVVRQYQQFWILSTTTIDNNNLSWIRFLPTAPPFPENRLSPNLHPIKDENDARLVHPPLPSLEEIEWIYIGQFGLGHRLSKLSAAYHLAQQQQLPVAVPARIRMNVRFGSCRLTTTTTSSSASSTNSQANVTDVGIFEHLFGASALSLSSKHVLPRINKNTNKVIHHSRRPDQGNQSIGGHTGRQKKVILIRNDVAGYYAGQAYKNAHYRIHWDEERIVSGIKMVRTNQEGATNVGTDPAKTVSIPLDDNNTVFSNPSQRAPVVWLEKMRSDTQLYTHLWHRLASSYPQLRAFQASNGWGDNMLNKSNPHPRLVIGLHLRAGNGEGDHFVQAQRGVGQRKKSKTKKNTENRSSSERHQNPSNEDNDDDDDISELEEQEAVTRFVSRVVTLIVTEFLPNIKSDRRSFPSSSSSQTRSSKKPDLLFLATDTASIIPIVQDTLTVLREKLLKKGSKNLSNHHEIVIPELLVFPQDRLPAHQGVSYSAWTQGTECLQGWLTSAMDMALLARSHVVIAGMRSTFTQTMPLSLVLPEQATDPDAGRLQSFYRYCEVAETGRDMSCFADRISWLFRQHPPFLVASEASYTRSHSTLLRSQFNNSSTSRVPFVDKRHGVFALPFHKTDQQQRPQAQPVAHKLVVHFPDVFDPDPELASLQAFLHDQANRSPNDVVSNQEKAFVYGNRFNRKYRGIQVFENQWTWANKYDGLDSEEFGKAQT